MPRAPRRVAQFAAPGRGAFKKVVVSKVALPGEPAAAAAASNEPASTADDGAAAEVVVKGVRPKSAWDMFSAARKAELKLEQPDLPTADIIKAVSAARPAARAPVALGTSES